MVTQQPKKLRGLRPQAHEVKDLKKYPFQETEATCYGHLVHESLELYIRDGKEIPPANAQFKDGADAMLSKSRRKLAERNEPIIFDVCATAKCP
jgi:hypothetical protein